MTPYKHYWPIKEDISDVLEVYDQLIDEENEEKIQ
jgi:hypothetical protein